MEPIAYLAMEIKQRELDSRLLIAANLVKAGLPVVLGQQWSLFKNAAALPPGLVLFKTVNNIQASNMRNFRAQGHLVAATDEEVLVCFEDACFFEVFSNVAAENCDRFFAQSDVHKTAIEARFPNLRGKTEVVGNSRIDFLSVRGRASFSAEANELRQKHGKYILFNTNYGQINSIWNDIKHVVAIAAKAGLVNADDPRSVAEYREKLEWEQRNMAEIVQLLRWAIANLSGYKIVIRPHPGERMQFWQDKFGTFDNVLIVPRSNPHPWLLGAELVVHTACTTGLESALLGKPTVNLTPLPHPAFDFITNWVNPTFKSAQDAAVAIAAFLGEYRGPLVEERAKYTAALDAHFPNHAEGISSQRIAESMLALLKSHGAAPTPTPNYKLRVRAPGFNPMERSDTLKDKFTVSAEEIIAGVKRVTSVMGLSLRANIAVLDDSLFLLTPN
ncbi:MAG: hypothetical protein EPO08_14500 [Rhodospirillaceae bacterium]|nr:MAG: hypothetical protein EPO08_14500 [Rhodospirillaceae bacterium]